MAWWRTADVWKEKGRIAGFALLHNLDWLAGIGSPAPERHDLSACAGEDEFRGK